MRYKARPSPTAEWTLLGKNTKGQVLLTKKHVILSLGSFSKDEEGTWQLVLQNQWGMRRINFEVKGKIE